MGIIKDSINKGFTVGDVTTADYGSEAKIKVKEYYELDKLERKKMLELAENVDTEISKRDIKIGILEEKIKNISGNNGNSSENSMKTYYSPKENSYYLLYKKIITKEEIVEKCKLTLDKYNSMTTNEKSNFNFTLGDQFGYELPVTLEKTEEFINGKPTGIAKKNLMFICKQFAECIDLNTELNLEFYETNFNAEYIGERQSYYKLFLPKLKIYISTSGELIFSENEAFGIWKSTSHNGRVIYEGSSGCPVIIGYTALENGDYEIRICLNAYYKNHYLLKTNVEAEKITSLPDMRKNLKLQTETIYTSIFYNSVWGYTPINMKRYLSGIPLEKIQLVSIENTVGTQVKEVNINFHLKEDMTITASTFSESKFEIFKNLGCSHINEKLNIELIGPGIGQGSSNEIVKAELTRSNLSIIVPRGESLTLKKGTTYKYRGSYVAFGI
ncbi:MAG: hypothetical protein LBV03_07825 [Fusobacteriales bacterium]|jgi:hypothetical protein|nr:hypothetical protein [Fusobacteriales bacterium]